MCKPSQYINDICYECNPQTYDMTLAKFVGQENLVEASNPDDSFVEYLYECCECGQRVWVDEDWVKRNAVSLKSIKLRQHYIKRKGRQLDKITDANKYTHRLSRVMLYHKLLTDIEVAEVNKMLKGDGIEMTTFEHAIRLLRNEIESIQETRSHNFKNDFFNRRRKIRLEGLKSELATLEELSK